MCMSGAEARVHISSHDSLYVLKYVSAGEDPTCLLAARKSGEEDLEDAALRWKLQVRERNHASLPTQVIIRNDRHPQPAIESEPKLSWDRRRGPAHYWDVELHDVDRVSPVYFKNCETGQYLAVVEGRVQCQQHRSQEALFHLSPAKKAYSRRQAVVLGAGVAATAAVAVGTAAVAGFAAVAALVVVKTPAVALAACRAHIRNEAKASTGQASEEATAEDLFVY